MDAEPAAAHCLRSRLTGADAERLTTLVARFEDVVLPPAALVHASFALPFCPPWRFDAMWVRLRSVLLRGGVLVGQLFGDRDTWAATESDMTFHTRSEVDRLLAELDVVALRETERDGEAFSGPKHWHVYDIIARSRSGLPSPLA